MDLGLKGKRALVSGASNGIGRACAIELAREGVTVCIVGRDETRLAESVNLTRDAGCEGFSVSADLSTAAGCQHAFDAAFARMRGVDIFVSSAGAAQPAMVLEVDPTRIDEALGLKLYSAIRLSQLVAPSMQAQQWGRIIYIAGAAGASPDIENLPVSLANVTMMNLTRSMSDALSRDGILVNVICPGRVATPRTWARHQRRAEAEGKDVRQLMKEDAQNIPAGRIAEPEEIASMVAFLSSVPCSYTFASAIYMDGGARRGTP